MLFLYRRSFNSEFCVGRRIPLAAATKLVQCVLTEN